MTDFAYCPDCAGSGEAEEATCTLCGGSGARRVTEENLALAMTAREWADEQVSIFFSAWCRIAGVHEAYGVESWQSWQSWGSTLNIVQDTSCRGCHDSKRHSFPLAWFLATGEERERLIRDDVQSRKSAAEKRDHEHRLRDLEATRAKLARLESELGQTMS